MISIDQTADKLTLLALPSALVSGWIIHLLWMIGLGGEWTTWLVIFLLLSGLAFCIKGAKWSRNDLRWLIAPACLILLIIVLPWWNLMPRWDAAYHLIEANAFIGNILWSPFHHGQDFLFRPPLIPALFSMEIVLSGNSNQAVFMPLLLMIMSTWQIQHLTERWAPQKLSMLVVPAFLLLPAVRYWGQLPYLDVAVAGTWILIVNIFIRVEKGDSRRLVAILGAIAAMAMLVKYVHVYLIGLVGWFILKDRNVSRALPFAGGWLLISGPFLLYNSLVNGDPLAALTPQTSFALKSVGDTLGTHTSLTWSYHLLNQLAFIGIIAMLLGLFRLRSNESESFNAIIIVLTPLVIIHAFILDWGESRYHLPWLGLALSLMLVPPSEEKLVTLTDRRSSFHLSIGIVILILMSTWHFTTMVGEITEVDAEITDLDERYRFTWGLWEGENIDGIIAGNAMNIGLHSGIESSLFFFFVNPVVDTLAHVNATHIITQDALPRFDWEADFETQLGHSLIEPVKTKVEGNWTAVLWRIDDKSYANPTESLNISGGRIVGDMLVLEYGDSARVSVDDLELTWLEVENHQQALQALTGDPEQMNDGCIAQENDCSLVFGTTITPKAGMMVLLWVE